MVPFNDNTGYALPGQEKIEIPGLDLEGGWLNSLN